MKKFCLVLVSLFLSVPAFAAYFIVNENNDVISKINYVADVNDLAKRKEILVQGDDSIELKDAEYRGGKIVKHKMTTKELSDKQTADEISAEDALIHERMHEDMEQATIQKMKSEGVVFKHH